MKYLQKVKCTGKLVRHERRDIENHHYIKEWKKQAVEFEGVIIGKRTLSNGITDSSVYIPNEHFTAYLVSIDMNKKPVLVLPRDIDVLENQIDITIGQNLFNCLYDHGFIAVESEQFEVIDAVKKDNQ